MKIHNLALLDAPLEDSDTTFLVPNHFASSAVILAYPDEGSGSLTKRLKELEEKGYDTGHRFRPRPLKDHPYSSEEFNSFIGRLELASYTRDYFVNASSLTPEGVNVLERFILEGFVQSAPIVTKFSHDIGLNLSSIIQKHLHEYLNLTKYK